MNSLATYRLYGGPAIAIALAPTVFDCISAQGEYLGGAIAPGMVTSLESLTRSAAHSFRSARPSAQSDRQEYRHDDAVGYRAGFCGPGRRAGQAFNAELAPRKSSPPAAWRKSSRR